MLGRSGAIWQPGYESIDYAREKEKTQKREHGCNEDMLVQKSIRGYRNFLLRPRPRGMEELNDTLVLD